MENKTFHNRFQLNGKSFSSVDELLVYTHNFSSDIHHFLEDWFSTDDCITVQTSGSTGTPKSISLQKEFVVNSAKTTGNYFNLLENTTALLCLPIAYIAGKMMLIRAIILGWHIDIIESSSFPLKSITKQYDFSAMVPLQLENSLSKISLVKKLIVGGGVVSKKIEDKIQGISTSVFLTYGMTETITHIAVKKLNKSNKKLAFYEVLPNVTIYKDDRNCLVIDAKKVSKEIVFTNDVVQLVSDEEFEWLGRFDNVINSGGIKLHPERIEEELSKIISNRFFVAGISDEKLGEKLILIVEGDKQNINFKNVNLSKYQIPKEVYFLNQFVETATKKVQRFKTLSLIQF
ncbi:AMP-binding protein [uncultured Polaribacter sp.]|uniref:AMP-binding protein n=1 Tax=uncultured Polaribacter sp. TaxID=174711 RepID=UPI00262ECF17|nr:AMP-binding protein [uncultured Polaribacter sp.]